MTFVILIVTFLLTSSVYAEESSNAIFTNLPPDPGAAGKLTLAGIDSDNDGVRDDVQRWIVVTYPNSQKTRMVLTQMAINDQKFILNASNPSVSLSTAKQMMLDEECIAYVQPKKYYRLGSDFKALFLNTYTRSKAWLQADRHLSGTMFKGLSYENRKQGCSFNPDAMPN